MNDKRPAFEISPVGRRIRLSTREIALSVVLTVAALVAIAAFSIGHIDDETAMTKPGQADAPRGHVD